jgi:hypothetical protein
MRHVKLLSERLLWQILLHFLPKLFHLLLIATALSEDAAISEAGEAALANRLEEDYGYFKSRAA